MSIAPAPGVVLQGGLDAPAVEDRLRGPGPHLPLFDTVEVGTANANVWVNPFIVQPGGSVDF